MSKLAADILAFDRMKAKLQAEQMHAWVLFHGGEFFDDFEAAATAAEERFDDSPCLIRQVGAVQLSGGLVFRPAHALDTSGL